MSGPGGFHAIADPERCAVVLTGDFDMDGVDAFDDALRAVLAVEPSTVRIDLSGVTYLGSAGLSCLVRADQSHPQVVLCGPTPIHLRLFEITGMCSTFTLQADASS